MSWLQYHHNSSTLFSNETMRKDNKTDSSKKLESHSPEVLTELPEIPASTSYAYNVAVNDMVQSLNKNHLTTLNDLAVLSDSETSSSTSWKRIIGIEQCDHLSSTDMIMEYQSRHQKESDVVRLVHCYDSWVSDPRKQTSSELPQVSERNRQQGEPNQLYIKLHIGECR